MSKKLIGTFYFKRTKYGNLLGEFTNNESEEIITEAATPSQPNSDYSGNYQSVWFDIELHNATLSITKPKDKYILEWTEPGNLNYVGEGMLMDDVLIGYYKVHP